MARGCRVLTSLLFSDQGFPYAPLGIPMKKKQGHSCLLTAADSFSIPSWTTEL